MNSTRLIPCEKPMKDGLWVVTTDHFTAGFVVNDNWIIDCAPILRRKIAYWQTQARWVRE